MSEGQPKETHELSVINLSQQNPQIIQVIPCVKSTHEYQNAAFLNDDLDLTQNFSRDRPGSSYSHKSVKSTISRSSVNCTSGAVRCPASRLAKFYSYKEGNLDKCVETLRSEIDASRDGPIIGHWLLVEIDHWDCHSERVIVLCERSLFTVEYDFIRHKRHGLKRLDLRSIRSVSYGQLKYPSASFMGKGYKYGACKILFGDRTLGRLEKWNIFNSKIPFKILTSHHILYNEKESETTLFNCDDFIQSLDLALSRLPDAKEIEFKEETIEIESYASLVSILWNQNWLGYQLDRNGVSF